LWADAKGRIHNVKILMWGFWSEAPSHRRQGDLRSGVATVPCALGQEIFLRPPKQKLLSLK